MSLQNRQKYESISDYENQTAQQNDGRKSQAKLIGVNKYIIIGLVAISITFFVMFIMNKETQDEINKKKMKQLSDQYKGFNKGPQISSREYKDKKNKQQNQSEQNKKEKQHFLGDDDHNNSDQEQQGEVKKNNQKQMNQEEKKQQNEEKEDQHTSQNNQGESESEEIIEQEETKKNKTDTTKKKEDQSKPLENDKQNPTLKDDKEVIKMQDQITDNRQENKVFFCPKAQYLFKLSCLDSCPEGFQSDNYDRLCKPKEISPLQIELKYYDKQDEQNSDSEIQVKQQNFYQVIKSLEYIKKDQVDYGFFFFNQIENDGFNFLNSHLNGRQLNNFLDNTASIIVALGGEESYYLENELEIKDIVEKTISDNPQVKKWYTVGIYDVGSYGALVYLNKLIDLLEGTIVLNPNYMNMKDDFNKKVDFSKYKESNILGVAQQNQYLFQSKDIIIIEDQNSIYFQHTQNYCNFTKCNIIKYDNSKFKTNSDEKIEQLLLAYIEQMISKKRSTYIENL
ncbi:transmembrane protein, putative (macronuclear) [Tetrahymena thermophila SB210]|uniref:Transmembrane protein, putative n=1 Tax=Tetrahymena thermophila (strain SB210) TaxID=312017 RepID=I7M3P0_TETTS|nr:transmembrane protein, putative [Tetrahymena thermophila SB210]EAS03824.2 transmembrane protein, putative [Tetrahymena thermophila SB210]|eukprot:XP_001024069.2 transmembrane protein, putative [Tetrahymena thermophila SB210]